MSEPPPGAIAAASEEPGRLQPIDALIGLIGVLVGMFVFGGIAISIVTTDPAQALVGLAAQVTVFSLVPLAVAGMRAAKDPGVLLGLLPFRGRDLWLVAVALVIQIAATGLYALLIGAPEQDNIAEDLGLKTSVLAGISATILVVFGAAISEEILFRGLIFGALRSHVPFWLAALLSSAFFGLVHLPAGSVAVVLLLTLFGLMLAYIYERTGSIGPCIVLHAINNALAVGMLLA